MLVELGAGPVAAVPLVLAQNPPPPAGKGDEFGKASPVALVVVLVLGLVTVLLIRSMTKRIKRLPASFDGNDADKDGKRAPADGPAS